MPGDLIKNLEFHFVDTNENAEKPFDNEGLNREACVRLNILSFEPCCSACYLDKKKLVARRIDGWTRNRCAEN